MKTIVFSISFQQELHDLRRQSARDEKVISSSKEELNHERRRSDLHEKEARELRGRVEEVRKLQQKTEDEVCDVIIVFSRSEVLFKF